MRTAGSGLSIILTLTYSKLSQIASFSIILTLTYSKLTFLHRVFSEVSSKNLDQRGLSNIISTLTYYKISQIASFSTI